jgi:hypothetical protein
MNSALFLFLILLLGLVLCSFLGGNCNREGLEVDDKTQTGVSGAGTGVFPNTLSTAFDNYNHFNGSSSPTTNGIIYYGQNGGIAKIITNADGTQSLQVTLSSDSSPVLFNTQSTTSNTSPTAITTPSSSTQSTSTSSTSTPSTSISSLLSPFFNQNTFYGPNGSTASIVNTQQGQTIQVNTGNGTMTFTQSTPSTNPSNITSTQYYGSTGTPLDSSSYTLGYNQQPSTTNYNTGAITGPGGNSAFYAQGPRGNTVVGTGTGTVDNSNPYSSSLPPGIPRNQIPSGEEDLYILKSQVVPPVCPACPVSSGCPRDKPYPPCAPCARCPEPSMTCKAVPNYDVIGNTDPNSGISGYNPMNNQYIPVPVLNDFSSF